MAWRSTDRLIGWLVVVAAGAVAYDGFHLWHDSRVNRALVKFEAGDDVDVDHPRLRFARAFTLQQDGKFEEALEAYVAVGARDGDPLRADINYNLANLYLRRALRFRDNGADDLAVPLIELAKETYRELLRADSKNWLAKYNLELALRIAPDVDLEEAQEEHNPEHNPRSAAGIRVRKPLP